MNEQENNTHRRGSDIDLDERTSRFGEQVIHFARLVQRDAITLPLIGQLVRSATSVGANYVEADEAGSKKEFRYRISLCKREARESQYWLKMVVVAVPGLKEKARKLWKEANELKLIFASIFRQCQPFD